MTFLEPASIQRQFLPVRIGNKSEQLPNIVVLDNTANKPKSSNGSCWRGLADEVFSYCRENYVYFQYGINCIQNSSWWKLSPSRKLLTPNTFLNFAQKINLVSTFQSVNKLDSDHSQEFLREIFHFGYKCFCIDLSYLCFVINLVSVVGKYEKMIKENFGLRQIRLASGAGEDWIHGSSFRCTVFIYVRRPVIWHVAATLNCLAQVCQAC